MSEGWIKTHRSKLKWEWFTDPKTSHLFEYLLLSASYNEYKWHGTLFNPGQLPFGLNKTSIETGLSIRSIRTSLTRLKSTNEVTNESTKLSRLITITCYDSYQSNDKQNDDEPTDKPTGHRQRSDKASTTNKKEEKEKKEEEKITLCRAGLCSCHIKGATWHFN